MEREVQQERRKCGKKVRREEVRKRNRNRKEGPKHTISSKNKASKKKSRALRARATVFYLQSVKFQGHLFAEGDLREYGPLKGGGRAAQSERKKTTTGFQLGKKKRKKKKRKRKRKKQRNRKRNKKKEEEEKKGERRKRRPRVILEGKGGDFTVCF